MATRRKSRKPARRTPKKSARRPARRAAARRTAARRPARPAAARRRGGAGASDGPESGLRLHALTPAYTVNDLEKTIAWYCDGLGFAVSERWEEGGRLQGVMLKAGSCEVGLSQDDFTKGQDRVKGVGFRIYADSAQDVDSLAERMRAHGGRIVSEPADTPWGSRAFTVEDPDGFRITFGKRL